MITADGWYAALEGMLRMRQCSCCGKTNAYGRLTIGTDLAIGWLCNVCLDFLWSKKNPDMKARLKSKRKADK